VRKGPNEWTRVGYDVGSASVFVDRRRSGATGFSPDFSGRHAGPLPLQNGRVRLRVLVDRSSVEVFAGGGLAVITDRIYPAPESRGVELWAEGGAASLVALEAWPLE
jgi:sucrose-6-phosphate hydrolase SacC (GH32 family)